MKKLIFAALLALSPPVFAEQIPQGAAGDGRIKTVVYDENNVVAIYSYPGVATHVQFAPGETILDIASGFSDGWEFSDARNNLYLKPKTLPPEKTGSALPIAPTPGVWDTNVIVTTNAHVYSFQLFLIGKRGADSKLVRDDRMAFRVKFVYPGDDAARAKSLADAELARKRLDTRAEVRNTNYTMQIGKRSQSIAPTTAYDDGLFTYFKFPNNREIPAVFIVDETGKETLVNVHVRDDVVVIQRVAKRLSLRLGKQVVAVFNEAFDLDGVPPVDGTTVDGVERIIRGGSQQ